MLLLSTAILSLFTSLGVSMPAAEPAADLNPTIFTASERKSDAIWPPHMASRSVNTRDVQSPWNPTSWPEDLCGDSTFVDETTGGSPSTSDCQCVADYSRSHNGHWAFEERGGWNWMATCGNCVFRAHTDNAFTIGVGNTDIADLVQDSIARFSRDGRTGASGDMGCTGNFNTAKIIWALYKR